ncbi:DNA breaking-rejoining enzyme [Irpex lacteus]|nr:DNA breaking-rejoining enzyme [Irpex lacteus]
MPIASSSSSRHVSRLQRTDQSSISSNPRTPRVSNTIAQSSLRPHGLARDRLDAWMTPFAIDTRIRRQRLLSNHATDTLREVTLNALEPNTKKNYGAGLLRFTQFCDCNNIPECQRMPASDDLVAAFVARWCGIVARTTIDTWLAGLSFWHAINGAPWPSGRLLRITCTAATKHQPSAKPKRPPVTVDHLQTLLKHLDFSNTFDTALTIPSPNAFQADRHVARNAPLRLRTTPQGTHFYTLSLPWSKTTKAAGLDVTFTDQDSPTSPVTALTRHLLLNKAIPSTAPLLSYETAASPGWAPMTRDWFLQRCNSIWLSDGMDTLTGHSFRIGGATELLLAGTPPDIVAAQGSWRSRAFLEYWRKVDHILPLFISDSFSPERLSSVRRAMRRFDGHSK